MDNDIKNDFQRSDNANNSEPVAHSKKSFGKGKNIFFFIVLILLAISLISVLSGHEVKTFSSLLNTLAEVPQVDFGWLSFGEITLNLPEWLAWLEVVVNVLADLLAVVGFFLAGIGQALAFVLYILRWIFL